MTKSVNEQDLDHLDEIIRKLQKIVNDLRNKNGEM